MAFNLLKDKKEYCGHYKGVDVWGVGCMIGDNWYGTYYITKKKNGRNYKVKDSECRSIDGIKEYINNHLNELKKEYINNHLNELKAEKK